AIACVNIYQHRHWLVGIAQEVVPAGPMLKTFRAFKALLKGCPQSGEVLAIWSILLPFWWV
ncbi:MAG: hypothetical protein RMI90_03320, partial [Thermoguttaceae bacterium]|nr:hypothetical protein [Thermoguttaceae bacterium]